MITRAGVESSPFSIIDMEAFDWWAYLIIWDLVLFLLILYELFGDNLSPYCELPTRGTEVGIGVEK
ncbi:hypothetical protein C470_13893 [Halorubrum distributum JCM 13561]|uniref:Uncharacterized protein n=1 Tax=Halorubrum distributum JCM 13561 TaxID=1227483 RepID=M0NII1_9EURY|nr:hypothetical protein C470_13893 [Halorubrum litoreum JCM 13561]